MVLVKWCGFPPRIPSLFIETAYSSAPYLPDIAPLTLWADGIGISGGRIRKDATSYASSSLFPDLGLPESKLGYDSDSGGVRYSPLLCKADGTWDTTLPEISCKYSLLT